MSLLLVDSENMFLAANNLLVEFEVWLLRHIYRIFRARHSKFHIMERLDLHRRVSLEQKQYLSEEEEIIMLGGVSFFSRIAGPEERCADILRSTLISQQNHLF